MRAGPIGPGDDLHSPKRRFGHLYGPVIARATPHGILNYNKFGVVVTRSK
jgi:hypothetical protein